MIFQYIKIQISNCRNYIFPRLQVTEWHIMLALVTYEAVICTL